MLVEIAVLADTVVDVLEFEAPAIAQTTTPPLTTTTNGNTVDDRLSGFGFAFSRFEKIGRLANVMSPGCRMV